MMLANTDLPPAELIALVEDINKGWLLHKNASLEIYKQGSEFDDEWKLRIVSTFLKNDEGKPFVFIEHLAPEAAHGHTYMLIVSFHLDHAVRYREQGAARAVARISGKLAEMAGCAKPLVQDMFEKEYLMPGYR